VDQREATGVMKVPGDGVTDHVHKLIEKHGRMGNMMKWREMLNADCPKRDATGLHNRCDLVCPDLPKVL
jgi:hypothetical protein